MLYLRTDSHMHTCNGSTTTTTAKASENFSRSPSYHLILHNICTDNKTSTYPTRYTTSRFETVWRQHRTRLTSLRTCHVAITDYRKFRSMGFGCLLVE